MKIFKNLDEKVKSLGVELSDAGKEPEKLYNMFKTNISKQPSTTQLADYMQSDIFDDFKDILGEMDESVKKIDELQTYPNPKDRVKNLYQGKGYAQNEGINRTLTRQFLKDEIEAKNITVSPEIYNAVKEGGHPFIDPIKVFRHHYGDNAFDILGKYIDNTYDTMGGSRYPGRFEFRKLGLVPKNKNAPGNTYSHYSLPGEIDQEIADIDLVIKTIEGGDNPFFKGAEDIKNQNIKRANLVKIKNEIAPEETKVKPGDELLETAEVVPIKQEGIISNLDLNVDRGPKKLNNIELYGDETFDELKYIEENGVHPRDLDPREGFARGGIVEVLI